MRFNYAESATDPSYYVPLARACEEAGFDGFIVPDSIAYPAESDTMYPFNPDGSQGVPRGQALPGPFRDDRGARCCHREAPFRHIRREAPDPPSGSRRQAGSDRGGASRTTASAFGVGTSPWPEDYELVGVPWENRGRRMDECIQIVRGLTAGGWFEHHGEVFEVPRIKMAPAPDRPIPVLIGGHGEPALRRAAATTGDGWMHGGGDPEELPGLLDRLRELREEAGRRAESVRDARHLARRVHASTA